MEKLLISNSPHIRSNSSTKRIMLDVIIALIPATIMGVVYFGLKALVMVLVTVIASVASEVVYRLIRKTPFKQIVKEFDYTSVVTGLILGLNLPSNLAYKDIYVPILGAVFAIVVVKMLFGGTGKNFVNPAVTGRVFMIIAFSAVMTSSWGVANIGAISGQVPVTGQTVLAGALLKGDFTKVPSNLDLFLGTGIAGCIGETCKLALLAGGIYLFVRHVIDWKPLIYIVVTGLMTVMIKGFDFNYFLPSILSGGLFIGAIFMASDYVTSPNTEIGSYIYYVLLGVLTAWLRTKYGSEVVSYVIMLGNICTPLIDRFVIPKPFGYQRQKKEKATKEAK